MCKFYVLMFFIIGANCDCVSPIVKNEISLTHEIAQSNHDFLITLNNSIYQKFASISEDLQKFGHQLDAIHKFLNLPEAQNSTLQKEAQNSTLQKEAQNSTLQKEAQNLTEDCTDVFNLGENVSKSYLLLKYNRTVLCDMDTDGGGWLVIQQRKKVTKQVDFNRDWLSYKEGFGDLDTEFWIGNEFLHRITNEKSYELRIDIEDFEKGPFYAIYRVFRVGNESSGYQLRIGGYEGNVEDRLSRHDEQKFTTFDRDNDDWYEGNSAKTYSGGFWYFVPNFFNAHLNGYYPTYPDRDDLDLIRSRHNGQNLILINVEMKIRPIQKITV